MPCGILSSLFRCILGIFLIFSASSIFIIILLFQILHFLSCSIRTPSSSTCSILRTRPKSFGLHDFNMENKF